MRRCYPASDLATAGEALFTTAVGEPHSVTTAWTRWKIRCDVHHEIDEGTQLDGTDRVVRQRRRYTSVVAMALILTFGGVSFLAVLNLADTAHRSSTYVGVQEAAAVVGGVGMTTVLGLWWRDITAAALLALSVITCLSTTDVHGVIGGRLDWPTAIAFSMLATVGLGLRLLMKKAGSTNSTGRDRP
jgi:hypothetical protein